MSDDDKPALKMDGLHVGDFVIRPVPSFGTDDHLDTPEGREADRQKEDDARAAQHSEATDPPHPIVNPLHPAPTPVIPFGEGGDVDASIEAARAAAGVGQTPGEIPIPILLRDPITGKVVGSD